MRSLIIGCQGQLGVALTESAPDHAEIIGVDLPQIDITDTEATLRMCKQYRPAVVVNAAAYTNVDQAESKSQIAKAVNVDGPLNIAVAAQEVGARLLHISTDFVFDGRNSSPYKPEAITNPLSVYGQTKRDGELVVLDRLPDSAVIMRTAWLYSRTGSNFVKTMLRLMADRDELAVVADQVGTPTWAAGLAQALWAAVERPQLGGIYHWSDAGVCSWYDFAVAIYEEGSALGLLPPGVQVRPIPASDYPTPARRPAYSVLDKSSSWRDLELSGVHWRQQLRAMLQDLQES